LIGVLSFAIADQQTTRNNPIPIFYIITLLFQKPFKTTKQFSIKALLKSREFTISIHQCASRTLIHLMEKTIYNRDYEALILWLKTARKSSGLTMRDLCQVLDCSIGYVQKIENGLHRIDALQLVRYCEAIGADVHEGIKILENKKS
jgi:hypothetical protein